MTRTSDAPRCAARTPRLPRLAGAVLGGIVTVALLTACGGGSTGTSSTADADGPGVVAGGGQGGGELGKILDCLTAAGIKLPTSAATGPATAGGGPSNLQSLLEEPASKKALKDCGLELPKDGPAATPST